jgi:hypothetical protein
MFLFLLFVVRSLILSLRYSPFLFLITREAPLEFTVDEDDFEGVILPAALAPGVCSASNRNEYQKHKNNNVSGE